jgi:hypothetical protein
MLLSSIKRKRRRRRRANSDNQRLLESNETRLLEDGTSRLLESIIVINGTWSQLGLDILGNINGDGHVSMNAAGDRIAISAIYDNTNGNVSGRTRIYSWNGTGWTQLGQDIYGSIGDLSGSSISMNAAGDRIAIGSPMAHSGYYSAAGRVRIYSWNGSSWIKFGSDIIGEIDREESGTSVSMNSAGDQIVIGATGYLSAGRARIYSWNGSEWIKLGADIVGKLKDDNFGYSVSMNSTGDRIAISAIYDNTNGASAGQVRIYSWNGTGWTQLGQDINGDRGDFSGSSISMNAAGDRIAIGSPWHYSAFETFGGCTRIYSWNGFSWIKLGSDIKGETNLDKSGHSVSLNDAGDRVVIGSHGNSDYRGYTRIYNWNGSSWVQIGLNINGKFTSEWSGESVSMNATGNRVVINSPKNDNTNGVDAGCARIYVLI